MSEFRLPPPASLEQHIPRGERAIEFYDITLVGCTDTTDVPLESDRDPKNQLPEEFWEYIACPYPQSPSRVSSDLPMSSFEAQRLKQHLPVLYELTASLRQLYCDAVDVNPMQPLSAYHATELANIIGHIPPYLLYRAEAPVPRQGGIDPALVILSHAGLGARAGLGSAIELQTDNQNGTAVVNARKAKKTVLNGEAVCAAAEKLERFSQSYGGDGKTVCAAGPNTVVRYMECLIKGVAPSNTVRQQHFQQAQQLLDEAGLSTEFSQLMLFANGYVACQASLGYMDFLASSRYDPYQAAYRLSIFAEGQENLNAGLGRRGVVPDDAVVQLARRFGLVND